LLREVLAANPRTIVVLEGGSAIVTSPWDSAASALLWAGYPGAQGGHAIADVLFGDVGPSGRLPFSMPVREEDLVRFDNTSATVTYEYLHGYRHLQAQRVQPRFAFGYGLSYSTVAYESLAVAASEVSATDTIEATVTVRNTGARSARETAQLYVAAVGSTIERAPMDLRAFAQQEIAAGASAALVLRVPVRELAIWDEGARAMRVEPGTYELRVGPDSERTPLRATITVR
jgi:beta-glucosidase